MSTDFNLDFSEAYIQAIAMAGGEKSTGSLLSLARIAAQTMMRDWRNRAIMLWTVTPLSIPLVAGTAVYTAPVDCDAILDLTVGTQDGIDLEVERIGRTGYANLPQKTVPGRPVQAFVNRQLGSTTITLYPVPDGVDTYTLNGFYARITADLPNASASMDLPTRFLDAFVKGLAYNVALMRPEVGMDRIQYLETKYEESLERAITGDDDGSPITLSPNLSCYWRT